MNCYFQGCTNVGVTKEHIPPKAFFPKDERTGLLTVKSCADHNNAKSKDDLYVLAQICMNASPNNGARKVFFDKVKSQLNFNGEALRKTLAKDAIQLLDGGVKYRVDIERFDNFFTALSCGIIFKSCGTPLPSYYQMSHLYPNFSFEQNVYPFNIDKSIEKFYSGKPLSFMTFGKPRVNNERIYTVEIFGIPNFQSSITIVHLFFGKFKVISMLTKIVDII
jgi:hypothetical protein